MRKILFLTLFLPFAIISAQERLDINNITGSQSVFQGVASANGTSLKYEDIEGSPYYSKIFQKAFVGEKYGNIDVRYNAYTDDIEFSKDGKVEVLPKQEDFYRVEVIPTKETFVYFNNTAEPKGYLMEIAKGKNSVYKKSKVNFKDVTPAVNTYQTAKPAMFKVQEPVYYLKTESGTISKISSLKKVTELFPGKEDEYTKYIKSNKLKFTDADLVKLMTFINQ